MIRTVPQMVESQLYNVYTINPWIRFINILDIKDGDNRIQGLYTSIWGNQHVRSQALATYRILNLLFHSTFEDYFFFSRWKRSDERAAALENMTASERKRRRFS